MIIWIASYPKSGNTMLRLFLESYLNKRKNLDNIFKSFDLNEAMIRRYPPLGLSRLLGLDTKKNQNVEEKLNKYLKINHQIQEFNLGLIRFYKTHNSNIKINNHSFTSEKYTKAFIYISRDPRNVLLSYANHLGIDLLKSLQIITSKKSLSVYDHFVEHIGSWKIHYNSWKDFNTVPSLFLKYEDFKENSKINFLKILNFIKQFIEIEIDEKLLDDVIEDISFEKLKKKEETSGFLEKGKKNFFDKGFGRNFKMEMKLNLNKEIQKEFKKEMIELGYF